MSWYPSLNIDAATGAVAGVGFCVDPNAHYDLVNRRSNKLLNVKASSTASGADTEQRADAELASQQWRLVPAGGGYYKIQNRNSGLIRAWPAGRAPTARYRAVDRRRVDESALAAGRCRRRLLQAAQSSDGQGRRRLGRLAVERRHVSSGETTAAESALADRDRELIASPRRSSFFPTSSDAHDPVVLLV